MVDPLAFDRHWTRWQDLRTAQFTRILDGVVEPWETRLVPRGFALTVLVDAVGVASLTAQPLAA
ncbi:MAG TPA: hypothetical protein VGE77_13750 [Nocardioides sp.]